MIKTRKVAPQYEAAADYGATVAIEPATVAFDPVEPTPNVVRFDLTGLNPTLEALASSGGYDILSLRVRGVRIYPSVVAFSLEAADALREAGLNSFAVGAALEAAREAAVAELRRQMAVNLLAAHLINEEA